MINVVLSSNAFKTKKSKSMVGLRILQVGFSSTEL